MGDTGSLPLGALLGFSALVIRQEALLVIAGGVFVVETLSVIIQVFWYRRTGVRVLACSPLHNHYLFQGQHEMKIVVRFCFAGHHCHLQPEDCDLSLPVTARVTIVTFLLISGNS